MAAGVIKSKTQFFFYRLATIAKSFKTLYTLSPEKIDAFLNSYTIYDHDWRDEEKLIQEMGHDYYNQVKQKLIDYYSVLNHLCSIGQVEKMYIPPAIDLKKSIIANQNLFEKRMAHDLHIKKGDRGLDIGCGRGRIASHVATLTGAKVTGMNIDTNQLESARRFAEAKGLSNQCEFRVGDLNEIPFPFEDNSLDFIYQVQVFSLSRDLGKLFKELYRMLKPGARLACLDWVHFDKYNPEDAHHADLMRRIKPLIGAIGTPSDREYVELMRQAGFKILLSEEASVGGHQGPLIDNADRFYTRLTKLIKFLVKCKILPKHFSVLFDRLTKDGQAFVEADRLGLTTSTFYVLAEK